MLVVFQLAAIPSLPNRINWMNTSISISPNWTTRPDIGLASYCEPLSSPGAAAGALSFADTFPIAPLCSKSGKIGNS
jgi:hypothetical protein